MKLITIAFLLLGIVGQAQAQTCYSPRFNIYHWEATKGTLPRFVVACIKAMGTSEESYPPRGFIIMLGKTNKGIYTIEGGQSSAAASVEGGFAYLAFTPFHGQREMFTLYRGQDITKFDEKNVLRLLWQYHKEKIYNPQALKPVSYIRNSKIKHDVYQLVEKITWTVKVPSKKNNIVLLWHLQSRSEMCWCMYDWKLKREYFD